MGLLSGQDYRLPGFLYFFSPPFFFLLCLVFCLSFLGGQGLSGVMVSGRLCARGPSRVCLLMGTINRAHLLHTHAGDR